ncbi:MAG TPA: TonB-dependent receptor [Terriglobales bacterium]|nr:TonB-dependent receptor [Terriglobales bacterium]
MKQRAIRFINLLLFSLFLVTSLNSLSSGEPLSTVSGNILDSETGGPLPGVTVMLSGTKLGTYSDLDGHFIIRNVPPGTYTLTFSMIGYGQEKLTEVQVTSAGPVKIGAIKLTSSAIQIKGVEVTAKRVNNTEAALLRIQQKAPAISDGISAEQISKSSASDAAGALSKVTGVTVVGGKYVYVRGMGERYSNTLLNGAPLPSPEPKKRVIPMDIIPANLLDNAVTTKTYTPDQWGDFSGGSVRLQTKEFPDRFTLNLSTSRGWSSETGSRLNFDSRGANRDWLGMDDGTRDIPNVLKQGLLENKNVSQIDGYNMTQKAQMFSNIWFGKPRRVPLNQGYNLSIGNQTELWKKPLGYIFSLSYNNNYDYTEETQRNFTTPTDLHVKKSVYSVLWGGIFNLSFKPHPNHKLTWNTTYTRDAQDEFRWMNGFQYSGGDYLWHVPSTKWTEQFLLQYKLAGEDRLPFLFSTNLDWYVSYGKAKRKTPDETQLQFRTVQEVDYNTINTYTAYDARRQWEENQDINHSLAINWTKEFKQWNGLPSSLKLGWAIDKTERNNLFVMYLLMPVSTANFTEEQLTSQAIDSFLTSPAYATYGCIPQKYTANKKITGTYLQLDIPLLRRLRMIGGIRREGTYNHIVFNRLGGYTPTGDILKDYVDWLPSLNLTYNFTDKMNLRWAMSKTITRPEYYELIYREDFQVFGLLKFYGNPKLEHTRINNYDLRWEFYPRPGELLAVSWFYKKLKNPIEPIFGYMGVINISARNIPEATNHGFEFEARKQLGTIHFYGLRELFNLSERIPLLGALPEFMNKQFRNWKSSFSINANYSVIKSEVNYGDISKLGWTYTPTNLKRAMVGQSPYVINLSLSYQNDHGTEADLLYNRFGERIAYVGINVGGYPYPDITEKPFDQLDLVLEQKFLKKLGIRFKANNLIDSEVKFMQGSKPRGLWDSDTQTFILGPPVVTSYKKGTSYSLSLSYSI